MQMEMSSSDGSWGDRSSLGVEIQVLYATRWDLKSRG